MQQETQQIRKLLSSSTHVQYSPQDSTLEQDITSFHLRYAQPKDIHALEKKCKLKDLKIQSSSYNKEIIEQIGKIKSLEKLFLVLSNNYEEAEPHEEILELSKLTNIKELMIGLNNVYEKDVQLLATMNHLEKLEIHNFSYITEKGLMLLSSLKNIKSFGLVQEQQGSIDGEIQQIIEAFPQLKQLRIVQIQLRAKNLAKLPSLKQLQYLDLGYTSSEDTEEENDLILELVNELKQLKTLNLSNKLTDLGWYIISEETLLYWKQNFLFLEQLTLNFCRLDNSKLKILSCMSNLKSLNIFDNTIGYQGLEYLAQNKSNLLKLSITLTHSQIERCLLLIGKSFKNLTYFFVTFDFEDNYSDFVRSTDKGLIYLKRLKNLKQFSMDYYILNPNTTSLCIRNYKHIRKLKILNNNQGSKQPKQNYTILKGCVIL